MNTVLIVGKLNDDIKIKEEGEKKIAKITLAVPRNFKNYDGEYELDFVDCILWDDIATKVCEYCKKGDTFSIKGRIQKSKDDDKMLVIAEKVTFLSTVSGENEE